MNEHEWFSPSIYEEQTHLAERELALFLKAVSHLFGSEHARCATEDWLDEAELIDSPPRSTSRNWRSVSIAASARLSSCIDATSLGQYNGFDRYQFDRNSADWEAAQHSGDADIFEYQ